MADASTRLREAREMAGFKTAADAARHFGWSTTTYFQHEGGRRGLRPRVASNYATAFGVTPEWLMFGSNSEVAANSESGDIPPSRVGLGRAILARRIALRLSQSELAERIKTTKSTVSRWESGDAHLTAERLQDVAIALQTTVSSLLSMEKPKPAAESVDPLLLAAWERLDRKARKQLVQFALIMAGD